VKYVYCLARNTPSVPHAFPPGLDGAQVHHISFREIAALISDVDAKRLIGNEHNALAHQEVVDAMLRLSESVIPCRFGTLFSDDKNILMLLKQHYELLDAQLTRLEGRIEVSVQTIFYQKGNRTSASEPAPHETSESEESEQRLTAGASYLIKKKGQFHAIKKLQDEADRFTQELNQAMSPFWSEVKVQKAAQAEKLLLSVCYLVDQQKLPAFKRAYQKFKRENPGLRLLYTGPWAPYTFADIDLHTDNASFSLK
jgi:hypothetical protein